MVRKATRRGLDKQEVWRENHPLLPPWKMLATMLRTPSSLKTVSLRLQVPRFFSTYTELEEGKETLASITKASPQVLAYFTASWCGPCKAIAPVFTTLAKDHGADVKFVKIDIDDNGTTSEQVRTLFCVSTSVCVSLCLNPSTCV